MAHGMGLFGQGGTGRLQRRAPVWDMDGGTCTACAPFNNVQIAIERLFFDLSSFVHPQDQGPDLRSGPTCATAARVRPADRAATDRARSDAHGREPPLKIFGTDAPAAITPRRWPLLRPLQPPRPPPARSRFSHARQPPWRGPRPLRARPPARPPARGLLRSHVGAS